MAENTELWVSFLRKHDAIYQAFLADLAELERIAINHAFRSSNPPTTEMYEARGVVKTVDDLRHRMTMYEREAQSNASRKTR